MLSTLAASDAADAGGGGGRQHGADFAQRGVVLHGRAQHATASKGQPGKHSNFLSLMHFLLHFLL